MYEETSKGKSPVSLDEVKNHLKISYSRDDNLIRGLIEKCIRAGESFTGRDFSAKSWILFLDSFVQRICLNRIKVLAISSIEYTVNSSLIAVPSTDFYLKTNAFDSEVLLRSGASWPTNTDEIESGIQIKFTTEKSIPESVMEQGILQHISYLYFNRGDFDIKKTGVSSGAYDNYEYYRIPRI